MSDFRTIPLTRGLEAIVDVADYEALSAFKWYAHVARNVIYAARREGHGGAFLLMHRVITGAGDGAQVDHANGNGLDNRRKNLRPCSNAQNAYNTRPRSVCGLKGVTPHRAKWVARIYAGGSLHRLGTFSTANEAGRAYDAAAARLHGEFAYLNFPEAA